jgi:hypothetical protein
MKNTMKTSLKNESQNNSTAGNVHADPRSGVALIIVLGLLSILTILCVAFAISMRVERMAARAFADNTRAEQLITIAMVRSMEQVTEHMRNPAPKVYPDFAELTPPSDSRDAVGSQSSDVTPVPDLRTGEAESYIPTTLQTEVDKIYNGSYAPRWITDGITNGRVAYVLINAGGLLDANLAGGTNITREFSEHIMELDLSGTTDITSLQTFASDRDRHVRYESTPEILELNDGVYSVDNLFYFSYDPDRDAMFVDPNNPPTFVDIDRRPPPNLGLRNAALTNKFDLNAIVNYAGYNDPGNYTGYSSDADFMANYYTPLVEILRDTGMERPDDVAWNIVNYLDPDRVPQGGNVYGWRHTEGGEAIPLVNEIVLEEVSTGTYKFTVELWYPFVPTNITAVDNFSVHVSVFTNTDDRAYSAVGELGIEAMENAAWSWEEPIYDMTYGTATEFHLAVGPEMTVNLASNAVRILVRVKKQDGSYINIVDEAPGYKMNDFAVGSAGGSPGSDDYYKRTLFAWRQPQSLGVNDPRVNGQIKYWTSAGNHTGGGWSPIGGETTLPPSLHTLGATNVNCRPWGTGRQGIPIYAKNGIMRNIGELGHIFRSNLDDEDPGNPYWRTIELMKRTEGAKLLDLIDVHDGNPPSFGLVSINTRQLGVLNALFNNLHIGNDGIPGAGRYQIPQADIDNLINEIVNYATSRGRQYMSFTDLFTDDPSGGPLADAFRQCAPDNEDSCDIYKEDAFRHISELITFRQNIFMVLAVAQTIAKDDTTVLAEKRAVATIYRDSYTGRTFTRSFKWLND